MKRFPFRFSKRPPSPPHSYWHPSLDRIFSFSEETPTRIPWFSSISVFLYAFLSYLSYRVHSLFKASFRLSGAARRARHASRERFLFSLVKRKSALPYISGHLGIFAIMAVLLFVSGAGGNVILGYGEAQAPIQAETGTLERVIITRTQVPDGRVAEGVIEYVVKDGDTVSGIGEKFRVSGESIRYANNLDNVHSLGIGQKLVIPPISGVVAKVKEGDTIEKLAAQFSVSPQAIVDFNYLQEPFSLTEGQEIVIPDASIPTPAPKPVSSASGPGGVASAPARAGVEGSGNFLWPTNERYITQYFSGYHPALDIAKPSPIYASDGGTIIEASSDGSWNYGYGNYVKIDHGNGYTTMYAHLQDLYVGVGDVVGRGQSIAMMGNTGRSFGTHVHFIVQLNGQYINPLSVL